MTIDANNGEKNVEQKKKNGHDKKRRRTSIFGSFFSAFFPFSNKVLIDLITRQRLFAP